MGIHYFTSSSNTRLHWIATWILALSPALLMAYSGDLTQQSLGEDTLHWMTHWDHLLVLLLAGGLLGSFKKWGGLGNLIGAASVLMAARAFSWTPASLNFVMSQGFFCGKAQHGTPTLITLPEGSSSSERMGLRQIR